MKKLPFVIESDLLKTDVFKLYGQLLILPLFLVFMPCLLHADDGKGEDAVSNFLTGQLLVAHERILDPRFYHSVLLVIRHGTGGAMALMINHPTRIQVKRLFPDELSVQSRDMRVYIGGPLANTRIMFLIDNPHAIDFSGSRRLIGRLFVGVSPELLQLTLARASARIRVYSGYTGWSAGQLERELKRGDWLVAKGDHRIVFDSSAIDMWDNLYHGHKEQQWVLRDDTGFNSMLSHL